MKVSTASSTELNQFIANVFEEMPPPQSKKAPWDILSKDRFWVWKYGKWVAAHDYVNTGDGLKMMLERFPSIELRTYSGVWSARRDAAVTAVADTLGRAVAEAFALDNGWKE